MQLSDLQKRAAEIGSEFYLVDTKRRRFIEQIVSDHQWMTVADTAVLAARVGLQLTLQLTKPEKK